MPGDRSVQGDDVTSIRRFDELNVGQLALISIQTRLPAATVDWEDTFNVGGREVHVQCTGPGQLGVPHGIDNDVSVALINLFISQRRPSDNTVRVSAFELLRASGLDDSGYNYVRLQESLMRLVGTTYRVSGWMDHEKRRLRRTTFRLLDTFAEDVERRDEMSETEQLSSRRLNERSRLALRLPADIADSVRANYLKPIDLVFMHSLEYPTTRGLFRLLDAWRYNAATGVPQQQTFEINIVEWARVCRIVNLDPDKIRRALGPAHKELIERGYLQAVELLGRGKAQMVRYVFAPQFLLALTPVQQELADQLMQEGVGRPQAYRLVTDFGLPHIEQQLRLAQHLLKRQHGIRNKGGFVMDVIRDTTGKYVHPDGERTAEKRPPVTEAAWAHEDSWAQRLEDQARAVAVLSPAEQASHLLPSLKLLLGRKLGAQYARLERACREGEWSAYEVHEAAVKAFASLEGEAFITELGRQLSALT